MKRLSQKLGFAALTIVLSGCGAQPAPQANSAPQAGKTSPAAPDSKVAIVKPAEPSSAPVSQPVVQPAPTLTPVVYQQPIQQQPAPPTCNNSAGSGALGGSILQTIGGFVSGNYIQGIGGIVNGIGNVQNKKC